VGIGALQDYIQEWQSPNFHAINVQPFAWLLLLTLGVLGASRRRLALEDFLLAAGFAYMGLIAGRNIALFALVAPMVITRHAATLLASLSRRLDFRLHFPVTATRQQAVLNSLFFGVLWLAVLAKLALVLPASANQEAFDELFPVRAVAFLRETRPPGRMFNSYNWGGYLLWELPEYPVFIDGRTDLYNDEVIGEWAQVVRGEQGWQTILERWDVNLILIEPGQPVTESLLQNHWQLAYADEQSAVYIRE
jgi:hypothetical protein